ncbi:unnamed protein product [Chrysoparadoxa australica]
MKKFSILFSALCLALAFVACNKEVDKKPTKKADGAIFYVAEDYQGSTAELMNEVITTYDAVWVGLYSEDGVKKYKLQAKQNEVMRTEIGVIDYDGLSFTLNPDNGNEGHSGSISEDKKSLMLIKQNDERTEEIQFELKDVNEPEHKGC